LLTWHDIYFLIRMMFHYSLLTNAYGLTMFLKAIWAYLTCMFVASIAFSVLTPNCFMINIWSIVIISPQIIVQICPSYVDSEVCKNSSNMFIHGIVQWTTNKPPKLARSAHCHYLDLKHLVDAQTNMHMVNVWLVL
jgi:hypothetical protein